MQIANFRDSITNGLLERNKEKETVGDHKEYLTIQDNKIHPQKYFEMANVRERCHKIIGLILVFTTEGIHGTSRHKPQYANQLK